MIDLLLQSYNYHVRHKMSWTRGKLRYSELEFIHREKQMSKEATGEAERFVVS